MEQVDLGVCGGQLYRHDPERAAIILPGAFYVPAAPLLWFAREALEAAGWTVLQVWDMLASRTDPDTWVSQRFEAARRAIGTPATTVVVAKSITTLACSRVAELELPAMWLTPLLHQPSVRSGLEAATAPNLLIGGTGDSTWDSRFAAGLPNATVVEVAGADHALQIPGDPRASVDVLRTVIDAVTDFATRLW
jgi:alpha-beta hydrolase superfamily lysophospholipase